MPSTISTSVSSDFASSTVITPSLPTFCMAWAIILPTASSPFAEMVPTWATSAEDCTFFARFSTSLIAAITARSTPRLRSIGFMPAATDFTPSRTMAWASTIAVVVPSPAFSLVLEATSRTIWAPMFSNLSSSSISFATVRPSLVMRGAPKVLSSTTLRPFGPNVTLTAFARISTPRNIRSRASAENFTSFAAISVHSANWIRLVPSALLEHAHDVGLLHDEELFAVDLALGARPLAEQHPVAGLQIDGNELARLVAAARPDGHHLALLGLLLGGVGDDDAALGLLLGIDALHDHPVVQVTKLLHANSTRSFCGSWPTSGIDHWHSAKWSAKALGK